MGSFAEYLEKKILDEVFGGTAFSAPGTLYIGLSTTTITNAGGNITEPSGNGYARKAVTNDTNNWNTAITESNKGKKTNKVAFEFAQATGSWGTITDWFIADASSGGNILAWGALGTSKSVTSGDIFRLAADAIVLTLD